MRHTVARGRVLLEDFRPLTLNPYAIAARAQEASPKLRRRFHALECDTPYFGPGEPAKKETS